MASPSELTLDCKPQYSYSLLLKSFGDQQIDQTQQLEQFLSRLEEERLKIDAFKRELPLCMQLLTNAVEAWRQQLHAYRTNQGSKPVLEEFIPLKKSRLENSEKSQNISDKANWMTTAQLWSQAAGNETKPQSSIASPNEIDIGFNVGSKLALDTKMRNGGAFVPFSRDRNSSCPGSSALQALPDLALASVNKDMEDKICSETDKNGISCQRRENSGSGVVIDQQGEGTGNTADGQQTTNTNTSSNTTQPHRKARRCWSPDLHRRFVNALQLLGGSQVATPKQIRELMKVDGLTNDEVKSHLQKYRLHTRRPSQSPIPAGAPTPQLLVLGGIWVPPEYATAAAAAAHSGATTLYGAHHPAAAVRSPSHFCATPVPQEFYTAAAAPAPAPAPNPLQLHHHTLHHQLHMYKATSQAHSSPDSNVKGDRDHSESIDDGKSESSSWKGESGDNGSGGDLTKGLAALREEGEESNGSDITLKF